MARSPSPNVYSVLVVIAFLALTLAVGVVWWKNVELTADHQSSAGFKNPFYMVD